MPRYFEDQDTFRAKGKKQALHHSKRQRNNDHILSRVWWSNTRKRKTLYQEITGKTSNITLLCKIK